MVSRVEVSTDCDLFLYDLLTGLFLFGNGGPNTYNKYPSCKINKVRYLVGRFLSKKSFAVQALVGSGFCIENVCLKIQKFEFVERYVTVG